jgi:ABC-2 type transport system permease protein
MYFFMYPAQTLVEERRRGTLRALGASPLGAFELWLGLLLTNGVLAIWGSLSQLALMLLVVGVPFRGEPAQVLLGVSLFTLAHLNVGCLFPLFSRSSAQLTINGLFFVFLTIAISGFLVPLSFLPEWTQRLSDVVPLKHALIFLRAVFLKGRPAPRELAAIALIAAVTSVAALASLRWMLGGGKRAA